MRNILNSLLALVILSSCISNNNSQTKLATVLPLDSASFTRQKERVKYFSDLASSLKLLPIEQGTDSFELRLWVSSMLVEKDLIIIAVKDNLCKSRKLRYYKADDGIIHFKEIKIQSAVSEGNFLDTLKLIDFANFPSQEDIKGFTDNIADGVTYTMEILTRPSYKILRYHCPEHFADEEINNKKFLHLIFLIDKKFHFYSPMCNLK